MAAITFLRPPPSLQPPAVVGYPGSTVSWNNSHGTRRWPPSIISMSCQSHHEAKTTKQAFSGLRAVHAPAPTPVVGNFSRSSRGARKINAGYIPRAATLECLTSRDLFQNAAALAQTAFRGSFGGEQGIGLIAKASFDNLVRRVMGLLAVADYQLWRLGWLMSRHKDILLSQLLQLMSWYLLQHIIREGFTMISFGMWGSTLKKCGTDVTKLAKEGKFDPVIGRQKQIDQVVQILSRRSKNSPCLIGDPGVGKTAIVEGLAQLIATGDVPESIKGKRVISIDVAGLRAGQVYCGQFEARVKNLLREVKRSGKIILFIDEVHTLVGAGTQNEGYMDVANVFKPALARGEMQVIGATTIDEYRKHIEKDAALERRFGPVKVPEATVDETIGILRGLRERYEKHHKVLYADEALRAAAELSHKYISDRFLPDKAIDLIDQSGSLASLRHAQRKPSTDVRDLEAELNRTVKEKNDAVRVESYKRAKELRDRELELKSLTENKNSNKEMTSTHEETENHGMSTTGPVVTEEDIRHIVSNWTGVPVEKLTVIETNRLLSMEQTLHQRVIGQDEAVAAISRAIRRAHAGLNEPGRPIGSFMFAGPTGVGKTELAKAVAAFYYGSETAMVRLDMSEFMHQHTVSRLIGSPPGYIGYSEGGQLTEAVRRQPHALILLDEIEKAHPDVFNVMLQVLDDGRLTDSNGRTVDFKNTLIIMTSNIGGGIVIANDVHSVDVGGYDRIKDMVGEEMKRHFRPEFLNRLDETIVFRQLTKVQVKEIAGIMLENVAARARKKGIKLQVTERFRDLVVEEGFDRNYGVRPLKRAILRLLEDTLADKMLAEEIKDGDSVAVDADFTTGNVVFRHQTSDER